MRRKEQWTRLGDLPYQEIFIPNLPPTTNHGYRPRTDENGQARLSKTRAVRTWQRDAELLLTAAQLDQYQGRVLVIITEYVRDFRSDCDGIVKFIVDSLQKQAFRNDSQVDCLIPHRLRVVDADRIGVNITIVNLGDYEIAGWDFRDIRVQGAGTKRDRQRYNNDSKRKK